ncbi:uncharacterized protein Tco025E_05891 [Trypanosoma conorhini]|uniref:Uncharacterized protein n=1 Tax=Trypanosoma conorhini TaxID=83891 RepID=A0A3R7N187_9TRYP|nr:uncharacterized protein Tco025E_05891 [Trypanosoma conorhini]RNF14323.1 hypothetical protein Tco025E_05891 [Trypanosoma conorhini]
MSGPPWPRTLLVLPLLLLVLLPATATSAAPSVTPGNGEAEAEAEAEAVVDPPPPHAPANATEAPQQAFLPVAEEKEDGAQARAAGASALVLQQEESRVVPFTHGGEKTAPSASQAKQYSGDATETQRRVSPVNAVGVAAELGQRGRVINDFPAPGAELEGADVSPFVSIALSREELSQLYQSAVRAVYEGNLSAAVERVKEGALHGHGRLHWLLGVLHANGIGVPQSDAKAVLHYTFAALENVFEAHMALGRRYADGVGVAKSCEDALLHYRKAADAVAAKYDGMPNPTERFAEQSIVDPFKHDEHDNSKLMQMLMLRADGGATDAIMTLGYANFRGTHGVRRNWRQARRYFLEAMAKGEVAAYGALGRLYATGDSTTSPAIERDLATAALYFSRGAKEKDAVSLNGMGYLHAIGFLDDEDEAEAAVEGGRPNFEKAAKFFAESAGRGSVEGAHNLGVLLLHGRGVPQDHEAAIKQFSISAMRGNLLSIWQLARHEQRRGSCELAVRMYSRVAAFDPIFERSTELPYLALSDASSSSASSATTAALLASRAGNMLLQALELLAVAETGHATSRYQVAQLLDRLPIIEETEDELEDGVFAKSGSPPERALRVGGGAVWLQWYYSALPSASAGETARPPLPQSRLLSQREALNMLRLRLYGVCAHAGNAEANLRLGDFYYYGESQIAGVSMSRALLHYEAAAAKQSPKAYFNLGFMYQLGLGVPGQGHCASVGDALYRIATNTLLEADGRDAGNATAAAGVQDAVLAEEMRLYLAKRYYDRAMEFGSSGSAYAVKLALMALNLQWWWLYFSHQQYGLSSLLQLPMPMARGAAAAPPAAPVAENSHAATTAPGPREAEEEEEEEEEKPPGQPKENRQQHSAALGALPEEGQDGWLWDDCVFAFSAALLFVLLLLRHHVA